MATTMARETKDNLLFDANEDISLDNAFRIAGEFGLFQKRIFIFAVVFQIAASFHTLLITFVGLQPSWDCPSNDTLSESQKCDLFHSAGNTSTSCTAPHYTDRFHSVTQEFNLICDQSYKVNLTQSWFFFGFLIGSYILGYLADQIGRRRLVIGFLILLGIVQLLTALSSSYVFFAIGRFLTGFFVAGGLSLYVLVCEVIGISQRSLFAVCSSAMFGFSFSFLSIAAYLVPYWRGVAVLSALVTLLLVTFSKYIPESPRWLYVKGQYKEAELALMDIAFINGRPLPSVFSLMPLSSAQSSPRLIDFFRLKKMRRRMIIQMLEWFTVCMVYYGLSLGVGSLSSNIYLGFALSGLVEIPSNLLALFTLEKIGRKWSNFVFLMFGGIAALTCSYVQFTESNSDGDTGKLKLCLGLLGKFSIASVFTIIFTYTPELIPTDMRNFGMGIVNVCARFGGIIAPLVILLDTHTAGMSLLVLGGLAVSVSMVCLYLPETLNTPLPNNLDELP